MSRSNFKKDKYFKYRNIDKGARYSETIPIKIIIDRCVEILTKKIVKGIK